LLPTLVVLKRKMGLLFLLASIGFLQAHYESGYEKEKPSPIVYYTFTTLR
jgi:hypothetical protein